MEGFQCVQGASCQKLPSQEKCQCPIANCPPRKRSKKWIAVEEKVSIPKSADCYRRFRGSFINGIQAATYFYPVIVSVETKRVFSGAFLSPLSTSTVLSFSISVLINTGHTGHIRSRGPRIDIMQLAVEKIYLFTHPFYLSAGNMFTTPIMESKNAKSEIRLVLLVSLGELIFMWCFSNTLWYTPVIFKLMEISRSKLKFSTICSSCHVYQLTKYADSDPSSKMANRFILDVFSFTQLQILSGKKITLSSS